MKAVRAFSLASLVLFFLICEGTGLCRDVVRESSAITARPGLTERIQLRSTDRLPDAAGEARVERRGGTTDIEVNLDAMKPASLFGGDYNTYVLWVVPPGEAAENVGEFRLDGDRSRLRAWTEALVFALLVTAEPHHLVNMPSAFVVLENRSHSQDRTVRYELLQGVYNFDRSTLAGVKKAKGSVHTDVRQAFVAVRLAQRADAAGFAPEELAEAQHALDRTLDLSRQRVDHNKIAAQARATIRLALAAQHLAEDRAFQAARVEVEGSGGGNTEAGRRIPRGGN